MNKFAAALLISSSLLTFGHAANAATVNLSVTNYANIPSNLTSLGIETLTPTSVNGNNYSQGATSTVSLSNNLGSLTLSGAQVVQGSAANDYAAPFGTSAQITAPYLSVYSGGSATFSLNTPTTTFAINWGSVDAYNTLTFDFADQTSETFTGSQIATLGNLTTQGGPGEGTNWGPNGSIFTEFTASSSAITEVVASSSGNSFEFSDARVSAVPVPGALPLFGTALMGLGVWGRRRKSRRQA